MKSTSDLEFIESITRQLDKHAAKLEPAELEFFATARNEALSKLAEERSELLVNSIQHRLRSNEALPPGVRNKLDAARQKALMKHPSKTMPIFKTLQRYFESILSLPLAASGGMVATACLTLTVAALFFGMNDPSSVIPVDTEIGLIASTEELELYENLDFYLWLAENEELN